MRGRAGARDFKPALDRPRGQGGVFWIFGKRKRACIRARVSTLPDYAVSGVKAQAFVLILFSFRHLTKIVSMCYVNNLMSR